MKKITLLTISAALLLTACGQMESNPAEVVPPPTTTVQEDVRQPQATPESTTAVQEPDTVSGAAQERPKEKEMASVEIAPQTIAPESVEVQHARPAEILIPCLL